MKYWQLFIDTLAQLWQHRLRTLLTLLGMIFGVGAVIAMLNIGEGAEKEALKTIDSMGLYTVIANAKTFEQKELAEQRKYSNGLTLRDGELALSAMPFVTDFSADKKIDSYHIFSAHGETSSDAMGVSSNYFEIAQFQLQAGRFFTPDEAQSMAQVVMLGAGAAQTLFPDGNTIGQYVKVNHLWFEVVGVLAPPYIGKGEFQSLNLDKQQHSVFMPLSSALHRFAQEKLSPQLSSLKFSINPDYDPGQASEAIRHFLNYRHNDVDDYELVVPAALLAQQKQTQRIFNIVMSCVAGISLLVGGIGIMNIMLATVLERTKEIGLLRAVGATKKDIRTQFIAESFTISVLGGIIGVAFGIILSEMIALYSQWAVAWSISAIILSFSICALVGLIFGVYPAIKASKLDPIDALQSE
ncbi:ABC transporter permease [Pseudoalteromonas sp. GB56]